MTETAVLTVGDLKKALDSLPDDLAVVMTAYESGYTKPKLKRGPVRWRGVNDELPHVFGEWEELGLWEKGPHDDTVHDALILDR